MRRYISLLLLLPLIAVVAGCAKAPKAEPMANGLLLSLAVLVIRFGSVRFPSEGDSS